MPSCWCAGSTRDRAEAERRGAGRRRRGSASRGRDVPSSMPTRQSEGTWSPAARSSSTICASTVLGANAARWSWRIARVVPRLSGRIAQSSYWASPAAEHDALALAGGERDRQVRSRVGTPRWRRSGRRTRARGRARSSARWSIVPSGAASSPVSTSIVDGGRGDRRGCSGSGFGGVGTAALAGMTRDRLALGDLGAVGPSHVDHRRLAVAAVERAARRAARPTAAGRRARSRSPRCGGRAP